MNDAAEMAAGASGVGHGKLQWKILIGFLAGTIAGLATYSLAPGAPWIDTVVTYVTGPIGQIFLRLLFMLVIPLLFSALVVGIAEMGEVRELRNVVERSATFCEADVIEVEDLPGDLQARLGRPAHRAPVTTGNLVDPGTGLKEAKEIIVAQFERDYLIMLLERHDMNISRVAREAGIDRRHVYRLMKKYDINPPARSGEFE